ncbi:MAG: DNA polymerase I [Candidatus Komeilibacteria bacterium]|nr:DNA polymerase I [Candidatus Komeilibacteria bacterium]
MDRKEKFVIIDGNALLHRAFHALPPMTLKDGTLVNAAYGFTSILLKIIKELKPDYICAAFDRKGASKRAEEFKAYKAQRIKQPDELYTQIPLIEEVLAAFNIPVIDSAEAGYEADDVIGTVIAKLKKEQPEILKIIVTGDLDTLQLVDQNTEVFTLKKGISETFSYNEQAVLDRYGLKPEQLVDYKALRGDPSDNIPGVRGIGEKTAAELIKKFYNLEILYQKATTSDLREKTKQLLLEQKNEAFLSKKLVTIKTDLKTNFKLKATAIKGFNAREVIAIFTKLEFKSLMNKIPMAMGGAGHDENTADDNKKSTGQTAISFLNLRPAPQNDKLNYRLIDSDQTFAEFLTELAKQKEFALDTETTSLIPWQAKLLGISFSWKDNEACYLNIAEHREWLKKLAPILENEKIKKVGHNLKYDYEILELAGVKVKGLAFDTLLAAYLLLSGSRTLDLDSLVFSELCHQMQPIEELLGPKGKDQLNMSDVPIEKVSWYSCEDADFTLKLKNKLEPQLAKVANLGLLKNLEVPLIPVLAEMEKNGIKIDKPFLKKLDTELAKKIKTLTEKIYRLAGTEFNIASPLQLKEILFNKLKIDTRGLKKIKTGLSTAAGELDKLTDRHAIIPLISEFREYTKLRNTYTDSLPDEADSCGRIHTSFNQTVTATGRLSSSNPNLQNIPIRTELGKEIRKGFIAEPGNVLISADYSQIELRVIASLATDESMIASFKKGEDIHARTAANINKIEIKEVTRQQRRAAKEINFGVIYGLGHVGLAQRTGINREEAKSFIEKYFELHPKIKRWLEETKELARKNGYVETLLGRRRILPDIHSGVPFIRAGAERMAINAPIQGTAADLLKLAMIAIAADLPKISPSAKMLLTVHDELVLEAPKNEAEKISRFVKEKMENVYQLKVPIVVEVGFGKNWGECK